MSLQQVNAFYDLLVSEPIIYDQYQNKCCSRGFFGTCHWDKTKIVKFAAIHGYTFDESDLDKVWFEEESSLAENSLHLAESGNLS